MHVLSTPHSLTILILCVFLIPLFFFFFTTICIKQQQQQQFTDSRRRLQSRLSAQESSTCSVGTPAGRHCGTTAGH